MAVSGCGLVCKFILILFNIMFAVVGSAFLAIGLWLRFSGSTRAIFQIQEFNSSTFVTAVITLIALGSVMIIVSAFGDYGACNEKRCALHVFSALVTILAIVEVAVGVIAYTNWNTVGLRLVDFYTSIYTLYATSGDPVLAISLRFIHETLHCCGITGVTLVEVVQETCPNPASFFEHIKMDSCPMIMLTAVESKAPLVLGTFIGTAVLLIVALICSSTLSKQIYQSNSSLQYIVLTQSTPALANPQPAQHEFVSTSYPNFDQQPVVFTPLPVVNIPVAQS